MKKLSLIILANIFIALFIVLGCAKDGPMGPAGPNGATGATGPAGAAGANGKDGTNGTNGTNGVNGKDGVSPTEACKVCHNQPVVLDKVMEMEYSKHYRGVETAETEGTRNTCAPCHSHQGFTEVCAKSTPVTFTPSTTTVGNFDNSYSVSAANLGLPVAINCFTCHPKLHTSYTLADLYPLANDKDVAMTMWGGTKTMAFGAGSSSNLCAKCHQPRPVTTSKGNPIDYDLVKNNPTDDYKQSNLSFRAGVHYGVVGAVYAGVGGIEFPGTVAYSNGTHARLKATCAKCHMSASTGYGGGHSFYVNNTTATGTLSLSTINYSGCNATGCHTTMSATSSTIVGTTTEIQKLISDLQAKIGNVMLPTGYLSIFDAAENRDGKYRLAANPTATWSQADKDYYTALPMYPTLKNAQFGGIINYQFALREKSNGVHNYNYIKALLVNTIAAIK
jgi:hypothetical protein